MLYINKNSVICKNHKLINDLFKIQKKLYFAQ